MTRFFNAASPIALGALLMMSTPAMAEGMASKARSAIAEASGKIDASIKVGTDGDALMIQSQAQEALTLARKELEAGKKAEAIIDAQHASKLADAAIAEVSRVRAANESAQRSQSEAVASGAIQSAANANARADVAQQTAAIANAQADAANARADRAPVVVMTPVAPTTATVTTETTETNSIAAAKVAPAPRKRTAKRKRQYTRTHHVVTTRTTTTN